MILVELYSKDDCQLCNEALAVLEKVQKELPFTLKLHKLIPGEMDFEEYKEDFPVIHINKRFAFKHRVNEQMLKIRLHQVANERKNPIVDDELDL